MIQAVKNPGEFRGQLELSFTGMENGKPWTAHLGTGAQPVALKQYGRLEGLFAVPAGVVVKSVTAKVLEGQVVRAVQTVRF